MERDKVIEKVLKLLNHQKGAEDVGSLEEAATAASKAQQLIDSYNIEQHELRKSSTGDLGVTQINLSPESWGYKKNEGYWVRDLMNVISVHNLTKLLYHTPYKTVILIGEKDKIENTLFLTSQLVSKIKVLCNIATKNNTSANDNPKRYKRDYFAGAVIGVNSKLTELKKQRESQERGKQGDGITITSLMVYHNAAIDKYVSDVFGGTSQGRKPEKKTGPGYYHGYMDGRSVEINQGIESNKNRDKLE